ncbi:serine--tRNA ligase [Microgenomates group bacterium RBG_16_45_19]|nr:MAG: serine--tRNA ligase [Microgenomates group bacterium RBG_16_45_19]
MLDINFIRDHADQVKTAATNKNLDPAIVDQVLTLDQKRRDLLTQAQAIRTQRNQLDDQLKKARQPDLIAQSKTLKATLRQLETDLKAVETDYQTAMHEVPNLPADDVPVGPDETGNQEVRTWGEKPKFTFTPQTHHQLALTLDLYDSERAVRIAGNRAYFLKNELVALEQAVLNFALKQMMAAGFTPMTVPWLVNRQALVGTGYFPWGEADHYQTQDGQGLIGTAEVSLTAFHQGEVLSLADLPVKLCGISPCFRREVGSYGKDTQGFFRLHQFSKVEMVVLTEADETITREWHEQMLTLSASVLEALGLPYRVLLMCTGDMGAGQRKKYDLETWFPGQNRYRETHSDSYFLDFQSRRLNIRYRDKAGQLKFVYTLNNTVAATPRLLAAILENYQQADGSVLIPEVLKSYVGFDRIVNKSP